MIHVSLWKKHAPEELVSEILALESGLDIPERGYPGAYLLKPPKTLHTFAMKTLQHIASTLMWDLPVDPEYGYYYNYMRYSTGASMGRHIDLPVIPDDREPQYQKRECVLSMVIGLTPLADYEGGALILENLSTTSCRLDRGDVLVFASNIPHSVSRVTAGTRRVLCGFFCGPERYHHVSSALPA